MGETIAVELFGGPADGRLVAVPERLLADGRFLVPVVPSLGEILRAHNDLEDVISPQPLTYEWDGTVREDGVRRFRLR